MLAAVHPAPTLHINAGGSNSVVNGPFRCDPPLHVVAQLGCVDIGECLLSNGADVNLMSAIIGDTPLLRAICHGRNDFVRLLHAHAADWLKPGRGGITPHVLASITQNAAALECCDDAGIARSADISSLDILRVLLAFPMVDAVAAAACRMLLSLWEQGGSARLLAENLLLQWFGLLLVSSADAGSPSPIISVLSTSLIAICRRSGRYHLLLTFCPYCTLVADTLSLISINAPLQFFLSIKASLQLDRVEFSLRLSKDFDGVAAGGAQGHRHRSCNSRQCACFCASVGRYSSKNDGIADRQSPVGAIFNISGIIVPAAVACNSFTPTAICSSCATHHCRQYCRIVVFF